MAILKVQTKQLITHLGLREVCPLLPILLATSDIRPRRSLQVLTSASIQCGDTKPEECNRRFQRATP